MHFPKINIFKYKYIFQILDEEEEKEEREIGDEEEEEREMGVKNEELEEVDAVPSRRHSRNPLKAREYSQIATNYRHFNCTVPLGPPGKYEEIIVATPVFLPSNEHIFFDRQLHIHSIPSSKDIERQRVLCTVPCRHALDYFDSSHSLQQVPQ